MMQLVLDIASWVLILAGSFFTVVGAIGLVRLPDVYTRMHARASRTRSGQDCSWPVSCCKPGLGK